MRPPLYFIFTLHNHQPVGNFGHVFQEAYEKAYRPFLDCFEKTSSLKVCLHTSGPLLDWLEAHEPKYIDRLAKWVKAGRIEILSGGYYEPILSMIREQDAVGQIERMNTYIEKRFKKTPQGFWLTERVWESSFPTIARKGNLKFTTVDDTHFFYGGASAEELDGYFLTENQGDSLFVFPISKELRYLVPFKPVTEVYDYLRAQYEKGAGLLNLADDGEKFGLWPGTFHSVYEEGWLENFFKLLEENQDWLKTITYSEALERIRPVRRIYLPNASYEEMMEWSLDSHQQLKFQKVKAKLKDANLHEESQVFIRGGFFRNYFAKYSESANMQNKQFYVSRKIHNSKSPKRTTAEKELFKGECNCSYWHGVFGGLYLHHLRQAIFRHLIRAEKTLENRSAKTFKSRTQVFDYNLDGQDEWVMELPDSNLIIAPHRGAQLIEWDDIQGEMNVTDTLTRRFEPYHEEIRRLGVSPSQGAEAASIHELKRKVTPEILENLVFDQHERRSWVDRVFSLSSKPKSFKADTLDTPEELIEGEYRPTRTKDTWAFEKDFEYQGGNYRLKKTLTPAKRALEFTVEITHRSGEKSKFSYGSEWNWNFKGKDDEAKGLAEWVLEDEWSNLGVRFTSEKKFNFWQFVILTISQSESSYNLSAQGTATMPFWVLDFTKEKTCRWKWRIKIEER